MPRFRDGRMLFPRWHRRRGQMHPRLFSGRRPRRWAHARFGTQTNPYGAAGGGTRQFHAGMSGAAGRVYSHMLGQARRGQGFNYGRLTAPNQTRSSRQLKHYRKGLAGAGRDAYTDSMGGRTRSDFGSAREFRAARRQARRERSQARRQYAGSYRNPYTGTSRRRVTTMSHQNPYTGVRMRGATRFTSPFTEGMRNRMKRHTKRYQGATGRYRWGQKNPTMQTPIPWLPGGNRQVPLRNLSLGGYRYMSPRFHDRLGQARRGQKTLTGFIGGLGRTLQGLRGAYRKGLQFNVDQNQYNLNRGLGQQNIA